MQLAKNKLPIALIGVMLLCNLFLVVKLVLPQGKAPLRAVHGKPAYIIETVDVPANAMGQEAQVDAENTQVNHVAVYLKWKLVNTRIEDHTRIETYQEFKVYKDADSGEMVTKTTPHYQYLRYAL